MFLPNYSGDGQGRMHTGVIHQGESERGNNPSGAHLGGEMPVWSGDGRRNVVNPLMPVYQADGRASYGSGHAGRTQPPQVLPEGGDGRSDAAKGSVDLSNELSMTVNAPAISTPAKKASKPARKQREKRPEHARAESRAERSEMWKLVALVVIFLIWISTASTLLFLYMDRYLFP